MRWAQPESFWGLLIIAGIAVFFVIDERRRMRQIGEWLSLGILERLMPNRNPTARRRRATLWLLAAVFATLALARPQWGFHEEVQRTQGLDVLVLLDISQSMETEDVVPSRLKRSKRFLKQLSERLPGDRLGLVLFAGSAYVACPLTTDLDYFVRIVDSADPSAVQNQGTDLGTGLEVSLRSLERGAEGGVGGSGSRSGLLLVISDGEDHEKRALEVASQIKDAGIKVVVLGVGTSEGAPIPVRDESGTLRGYKRDKKGQVVTSRFNPESLTQIAEAAGGKYISVSSSDLELDQLTEQLTGMSRGELDERRVVVYEERYQWPLALALLFWVLELLASYTLRPRIAPAASVALAVLLFFGWEGAHEARADALRAYIENEKGLQALSQGKVDEAKRHLGEAQARAPQSPELKFNQGLLELSEGRVEPALEAFKQSGASPDIAGDAWYNQGFTYAAKNDFDNARRAYLSAIQAAKRQGDENLEKSARKNLELLNQQQQEQQKQSQQKQKDDAQKDQSEGGEGSQDKKDQGKPQDSQKPQDQDEEGTEGKSDPKSYSQGGGKQKKSFQSQKLSEQDVERVMSELSNKERELQNRLKKRGSKTSTHDKDW